MNRWDAVKAIQKYSSGLDGLIYYFEEEARGKRKSLDEVKALHLILPLPIAITFPLLSPIVVIGKQFEVDFDIIDIEKLRMEIKGKEFFVWEPHHKPVTR